ncbi:MAG: stage III sporulation protein AA [Clostridia bacterium]|nr:stage III sporulation protein AA [Clostridia bacterium]
MDTILEYMPYSIREQINKYIGENIEEIRLRVRRPITLKIENTIKVLQYIVKIEEILETFEKICENSVYSYRKQICEGFITIRGGHRVGITGNCVFEDGQVQNINYISSLNFRIAREKKGCANELLKEVFDFKSNSIYNTLIVSTPGAGKTTILRDLIRQISNMGITCGLVDERGEIAAMYKGVPQNDIGVLTDVISNVSKSKGMNMLVRSMAPQVIACDEIGSKEDVQAINYAVCSGVKGVFTAHGSNLNELLLNTQMSKLLNDSIIEKIIILDSINKGKIKEKFFLEGGKYKYYD